MTAPDSLRTAGLSDETPMQASKWLKVQVLMEAEEMESLFSSLGHFEIYLAGTITPRGLGRIDPADFLEAHCSYIGCLKEGKLPPENIYRSIFSSVFTASSDHLYAVPLDNGKQLVRIAKPVIQLQAHSMDYSIHDGKFRPMVFGSDCIAWGIQFSYPQLYEDHSTKEVLQIRDSHNLPNTHLFHILQRWMRQHTIPTPFLAEDKKINVPMRLGKGCFPWINLHPQLMAKNLKVIHHGN